MNLRLTHRSKELFKEIGLKIYAFCEIFMKINTFLKFNFALPLY